VFYSQKHYLFLIEMGPRQAAKKKAVGRRGHQVPPPPHPGNRKKWTWLAILAFLVPFLAGLGLYFTSEQKSMTLPLYSDPDMQTYSGYALEAREIFDSTEVQMRVLNTLEDGKPLGLDIGSPTSTWVEVSNSMKMN